MGKKALVKLEQGLTASSVAFGCASLLDAGLEERLGSGYDDEQGLGNGGQLAVRVALRMQHLKHNFEVAQEALERIRDTLRADRKSRDVVTDKLYERVKDLRQMSRAAFEGDTGDRFLGLRGTLPREPKELHALTGPVVNRLADAEWPMPQTVTPSLTVDRDKSVRWVIELYRELDKALTKVKVSETRKAIALAAKERAEEAHDEFLGKGSRFLEAALDLAGLDDLAAAVRPDQGRRGRPPKKKLAAAKPTANTTLLAAASAQIKAQLPAKSQASGDDGERADLLPDVDDEAR